MDERKEALRILTVDDSHTMRRIILNILHNDGYKSVFEASNGKEAIAKMKVEDIEFVITDWNMPEMDGIALVKHLREDKKFNKIPILMVTIHSSQDDIIKAMRAGVDSYIVKPFTPEILTEKIEQLLSKKVKQPAK